MHNHKRAGYTYKLFPRVTTDNTYTELSESERVLRSTGNSWRCCNNEAGMSTQHVWCSADMKARTQPNSAQRAIPVSVVGAMSCSLLSAKYTITWENNTGSNRMSSSTLLCRFHFQEFISIRADNPSLYKYVVRNGNRILTATWITTGFSLLLTAKMSPF